MTQQCAVCGQSYGMTHACPGPAASPSAYAVPDQWATPKGFSPMFYLRQAVAIARFDDAAILAASRDPVALVYGGIFWLFTRAVIYVAPRFVLFRAYLKGYEINLAQIVTGICILVVLDFLLMLAQYAISHGLARWWPEASTLGFSARPGSVPSCCSRIRSPTLDHSSRASG